MNNFGHHLHFCAVLNILESQTKLYKQFTNIKFPIIKMTKEQWRSILNFNHKGSKLICQCKHNVRIVRFEFWSTHFIQLTFASDIQGFDRRERNATPACLWLGISWTKCDIRSLSRQLVFTSSKCIKLHFTSNLWIFHPSGVFSTAKLV